MADFADRVKLTPEDAKGASKPKIEADVSHLDWAIDVIKRFPDADIKLGSTCEVVAVKLGDERLPRSDEDIKSIYEALALGPGQRHATSRELAAYSKNGWDGASTVAALGETFEHPAYGTLAPMLFHHDADEKRDPISGVGMWVPRWEPLPLFLVAVDA